MRAQRTTLLVTCPRCGIDFPAKPYSKTDYCSRQCWIQSFNRAERLWDFVEKTDGCWEWTGARNEDGYGRLYTAGENWFTHRYSWVLHNGPIPDGLWVLHHCDNPPCIRPDHLFLGTAATNVADMVAKDRQSKGDHVPPEHRARGDRHWSRRLPEKVVQATRSAGDTLILTGAVRGERNPRAKLKVADVVEIRRMRSLGVTYREIADRFGISKTGAKKAASGENWGFI